MVEHLTFEELLQFNAMTYEEATKGTLAPRVTSHVRACKECRTALVAIQGAEDKISAVDKAKTVTAEKRREKLF